MTHFLHFTIGAAVGWLIWRLAPRSISLRVDKPREKDK
jgi:hypothetical protein